MNDESTLDERIEKRMTLYGATLELEMRKALDDLYKARFESAIRLLGWTFGVITVAFSILGIKTWLDIREVAKTAAIKEVHEKLSIDDPNSEVRRSVDRVVARGLINTYSLELLRSKRNGADLDIPEMELARLVDLMNDPKALDADFKDASRVLSRSRLAREGGSAAVRPLYQLGLATEKEFQWITEQPAKRAAIFDVYRPDDLRAAARKIIADDQSPTILSKAAIGYLARKRDTSSIEQLEKLATQQDEQLATSALYALATIAPNSPVIANSLVARPDASDEQIAATIRLAARIAEGSNDLFLFDDPHARLRTRLSAGALGEAIRRGYSFDVMEGATLRPPGTPAVTYEVPSSLFIGGGVSAFRELFNQTAKAPPQLTRLIQVLCLEARGQCNGAVILSPKNGGQVILANGSILTEQNAPTGISLMPSPRGSKDSIIARWSDQDGYRQVAAFDRVINAEQIAFDIGVSANLDKEEDE
jgi:hypothetical protein